MTQKTNKILINEIFSKRAKQNFNTYKTNNYQIDDIWSADILDSKEYGVENNKG